MIIDDAIVRKISSPAVIVLTWCNECDRYVMSKVINSPQETIAMFLSFHLKIFSINNKRGGEAIAILVGELIAVRKLFQRFMTDIPSLRL
ncbi:hypothetical protein A2690_02925 [Candidatus Roizmanbacteria bacterium RIFCSPHIGHO2_01_FULL_39_12b]|uniref:Uncharacterized protein n=1 Tax=Candidatus Roizmanbacteria bacterium RIFCSPHIGHO2_01_FULL_39_12b TaxID=1802030 RepID=A0A1F7G7Z9_9BACT|nr:MAG: hypothetical protein A2690_02925 [Candidatus Roizmanbacteria bacterium RIFCSPHIGHO2_01_FULL_39_12b]OGK45934.1 MAG: hypothetical protein A3B46_02740 [Candidatus Roizmanbacteria bacterium RIFCSPLOWO2_01_FULL_39_19]